MPRRRLPFRLEVEWLEDRTMPSTAATPALAAAYGQLPLAFQANQGQAPAAFNYVAEGSGYTLGLNAHEAMLGLLGSGTSGTGTALTMQLVGGNSSAPAVASDPLITHTNYLVGPSSSQWITNVPSYGQVTYHDVYQGTDLTYSGNQGQLEYTFTVSPGAKVNAIQLQFQGQQSLSVDSHGNLVIQTAGGSLMELAPVAYQVNADGSHSAVSDHYVLEGNGRVGFAVGAYDPTRPLIIDPTLSYSSYLSAIGYSVAVDSAGDAYVAASAPSTFPTTPGAFQTTGQGILVAKLNPAGTALLYATFLGNNNGGGVGPHIPPTHATSIAVDSAGDAYLTGTTLSGLPTTPGALQSTYTGGATSEGGEGFFTVLNPTGSGLVYSTYLPGVAGGEGGGPVGESVGQSYPNDAIAIDSAGNAYLAGTAFAGLPTTAGAYQTTDPNAGGPAAYFMEINPQLSGSASLVFSTYLGASNGPDFGTGIAVDSSGKAYVTGVTTTAAFATPGAYQTAYAGGVWDVFVAKIDPTQSGPASLVYATLLGGNRQDGAVGDNQLVLYQAQNGPAIAVDSAGDAYVTGVTTSTNFPTTPGAFQTTSHNSGSSTLTASDGDAFVTEINPTGTGLVYSTYLGGSARDGGTSIAVDASGDAYVTGWACSADFPVQNPIQGQKASGNDGDGFPNSDVFVTELNPTGTGLLFSTFLGGGPGGSSAGQAGDDYGFGLALDGTGNVYVTGNTLSSNFPTTAGAYQTTAGYGFLAKINAAPSASFAVTGFPSPTTAGVAGSFTVTALNADGTVNTGYTGTVHFSSSDLHAVLPADYTFMPSDQGTHTFSATFKTAGSQSLTATDTATGSITGSEAGIVVNPAAATQLVLAGPSSVSAGAAFNVTATAEDAYGNTVTGYSGTVHFSSTDNKAILPGDYTFGSADQGTHTFSGLKLKTRGTQRVILTDKHNSSITGSLTISVT
jgi:hypothetical protein